MNKADIELSQKLAALSQAIDEVLQEQYGSRCGFVLLIAPFNQESGTQVQYTSNIERGQAIPLLATLFKRWRLDLPDVPSHEQH